ncbi:solute carrier family 28 member 3-like isoform X2 [Anneissia japonica]|uniref:solute carrier family 28 member 3-like isoform X2 n=1 Tax=Anneissia japonica TaxID=1529436 RepID=UPI0014259698|nr:solute carrier family 28 member 3-like isoform X2 [Anneissia japonica]
MDTSYVQGSPDSGNFSIHIHDLKSCDKKAVNRALEDAYEMQEEGDVYDFGKMNGNVNLKDGYEGPTKITPNGDELKKMEEGDIKPVYSDKSCALWSTLDLLSEFGKETYVNYHIEIKKFVYGSLVIGWIVYLVFSCLYDFSGAKTLLYLTGVVAFLCVYCFIRDHYGDAIWETLKPSTNLITHNWNIIKWPVIICIIILIVFTIAMTTKDNPQHLVSGLGPITITLFCFVFSKHPKHVNWRPVVCGLILQFLLGLFVLRSSIGYYVFSSIGAVVANFLSYSDYGASFLFGELYTNHFFAFKLLPVVIYFSSCIAVLYYLGAMQVVVSKIAWVMSSTMKTSACESLNAAGNIFIGQTEAPLLIQPFLNRMTRSELHAVMTGGFATIAGSVLGAYIGFGVSPTHLISASVMAAPAALALSKLFYPETEESQSLTVEQVTLPKGKERNVIEAASSGASNAVGLVANIAVNLIAFLALLAFLNALLGYLGSRVGIEGLSFEMICSYLFMPIAFVMGVEWKDCGIVAELIGTKTFVNEFVAYDRLAGYINDGSISVRSQVITTYALCGFANIGSVGIQLGGLSSLAPSKKSDLAAVAIRALITGTLASFMTASIAGLLYVPVEVVGNFTTAFPAAAATMVGNFTTALPEYATTIL